MPFMPQLSHRNFIKLTRAGVAAPMILPQPVFGANAKINMAWIGA
jgi:hypothetical protein